MDKTKESQIVRDALEHQIKELNQIHSEILRESAKQKIIQSAMFRLAHIWLGDIQEK